MNKTISALVSFCLTGLIGMTLVLGGCKADHEGLATVTVTQLAEMIKNDARVVAVDANSDGVRGEYGVIPGAILLTTASSYDPATDLPAEKDRSLVFYCSSERCSAAPSAARKAVDAGYTGVYVLPQGIKGWVAEGMPVDKEREG